MFGVVEDRGAKEAAETKAKAGGTGAGFSALALAHRLQIFDTSARDLDLDRSFICLDLGPSPATIPISAIEMGGTSGCLAGSVAEASSTDNSAARHSPVQRLATEPISPLSGRGPIRFPADTSQFEISIPEFKN